MSEQKKAGGAVAVVPPAKAAPAPRQAGGIEQTVADEVRRDVRDFIASYRDEIAAALPRVGITPERLVRLIFTAFSTQPTLYLCTKTSIIAACIEAATLGIEPDGTLNRAWLLPYKDRKRGTMEAQLQLGYQGYKILALRSGRVVKIDAAVVRAGDEFEFEHGTNERLRHVPHFAEGDRARAEKDRTYRDLLALHHGAPIEKAYAFARLKDHEQQFAVIPLAECERARAASRAPQGPGWTAWFPAMCAKTAIIRLCTRQLPASTSDDAMAVLLRAATAEEGRDLGYMPADARLVDFTPEGERVLDRARELDARKGPVVPVAHTPTDDAAGRAAGRAKLEEALVARGTTPTAEAATAEGLRCRACKEAVAKLYPGDLCALCSIDEAPTTRAPDRTGEGLFDAPAAPQA